MGLSEVSITGPFADYRSMMTDFAPLISMD